MQSIDDWYSSDLNFLNPDKPSEECATLALSEDSPDKCWDQWFTLYD